MTDSNQDILDYVNGFVRMRCEEIPRELKPLYYLLKAQFAITSIEKPDLSPEQIYEDLLEKLKARMCLGMERYGHGIRLEDDTRQWGTRENSWLEMCEEEVLDGIIYSSAHRLLNDRLIVSFENHIQDSI